MLPVQRLQQLMPRDLLELLVSQLLILQELAILILTSSFVGDLTGNVTGNADSNFVAQGLTGTGSHVTCINNSGIVTAASFSGSGSGLSAGTTPLTTLDIDGADDIGADLLDADLIVVDDGAGGTNRKAALHESRNMSLVAVQAVTSHKSE